MGRSKKIVPLEDVYDVNESASLWPMMHEDDVEDAQTFRAFMFKAMETAPLSAMEARTLLLLKQGYTEVRIAEQEGITRRAVRAYVTRAKAKIKNKFAAICHQNGVSSAGVH